VRALLTGMQTEARFLAAGTVFAERYRIEALIDDGGAGAVYRALDVAHDRPVALKVLAPEVIQDEVGLARFRREADLVQRLSHPNVVRVYDFDRAADGSVYLVLENLRGQPLSALMRAAGPLPIERVHRIGSQILKGLMAAHEVGIVHRDIRPSSIYVGEFVGEPDFVTLVDFGIAKMGDGDATGLTRAGVVDASPGYAAPEQLRGGSVGPSTDLYSVGLVLAEMLAGRPVVAPGTAMQTLVSPGATAPLPADASASPLGAIIDRATQQDASRRFASAREMLAAMDGAASPTHRHLAAPHAPQQSTAALPVRPIFQPFVHVAAPVPQRRPRGSSVWIWIVVAVGGLACLGMVAAGALYMLARGASDGREPSSSTAPPPIPAPPVASVPTASQAQDAGAPSSALPPFNRRAANEAVQSAARSLAQSCNRFGAPFGSGEAIVSFGPSGAPNFLPTANHANRNVRDCMESALKSVRIAPFAPGASDTSGRAPFSTAPTEPTPPTPTPAPTPTPTPIPKPTATVPTVPTLPRPG
jgi:serine/threonine-protein kinase